MTIKSWLSSFLGLDDSNEMLDMELDNLYFRFKRIDVTTIEGDIEKKSYEYLQECFKSPPKQWIDKSFKSWRNAYCIEKQISMLLTGKFLHQEIQFRLREAVDRKARDSANLESDYRKAIDEKQTANGDGLLRNLLREILENNHWDSELKYLKRKFRIDATKNMLLVVVIALICFLVVFPKVASDHPSQLLILLMVATCGLLGALFSRLITLHSKWDVISLEELRSSKSAPHIFLRSCIGVCGALILYFILRSQMLAGSIFPNLERLTQEARPDEYRENLARLVVWSIIAGFSESRVPSVLSTTGQYLTDARK